MTSSGIGLPGPEVRVTGGAPLVGDGEGTIVVTEGTVDAYFVPRDAQGRPVLPAFVAHLGPGDAIAHAWWKNRVEMPPGEGLLRAVGDATVVELPAGAELSEPVREALARFADAATKVGEATTERSATESARLERRRELDDALESEGDRALLKIVQFRSVARRPLGLSPLATALADAATAAGSPPDESRLKEVAADEELETRVEEVAARLRVPIRAVSLDGQWWAESGQPIVAYRGDEPVALLPHRRGYVLRDATGTDVRVDEATAGAIEAKSFAVYPRLPDRPLSALDLLRLGLHGRRMLLAALVGLTAVIAAFGAFVPYATAQIVGVIVPAGSTGALPPMLLAISAFTVAYLAATIAQGLAVLALSSHASAGLTAALWDRLLHLSPSFFRDRPAGRLAQEVTVIDQMRTLVGSALVAGLAGSAMSVSALVLLFGYSPTIGLLVLAVLVIALGLAGRAIRRQGRELETVVEDRNALNGLLLGLFSGLSKLRVAGAERRAHALWQRGYAAQQEGQRNAALQGVHLSVLQSLLPGASVLAIMIAIAALQSGSSSLADFTGSVAASGQLAAAAGAAIVVATTLVQLRPLYHAALPILETRPEARGGAPLPSEIAGEIRLDRVSFGYAKDSPILDEVSLTAEAGSFVAIVGPSGAGKSTIFRMILAFEEPWSGEVLLDGKPINSLDVEGVRRRIGTVIQNARIMAGPILTNILGSLPLGQEAAWEAAEMAGVANEIRAMPMQMHTMVSEGGSGFSGGQIQRILLARALVRKPKILLLDEATSALDNETQKAVIDRLGKLGVTRIVVAHRLSTIVAADHIVVVDRGKVVEDGPYEELMEQRGRFFELASRQLA